MHHIMGAYMTYFNIRHQRPGHLFQGRYKAILAERDEYAAELSRYIHLNPVRANLGDRPEKYSWSSYPFFIGLSKAPTWLVTDFIRSYFGKRLGGAHRRYRDFVEVLLGQKYRSPLEAVVSWAILGGADFVAFIKDRYLQNRGVDPHVPALRALAGRPSVDRIIDVVEAKLGKDRFLARGVELYLSQKHTGKRLREIGGIFRIGESGVSQASRRMAMKIAEDHKLRKIIEEIEDDLNLSRMKT